MELAFRTRRLRTLCEDDTAAQDEYGPSLCEQLRSRLADLRAVNSIDELIVGQPTIDPVDRQILRLKLTVDVEMELRVNHPSPPVDEEGAIDWSRVRRLQVLNIGTPS
jgi:proteic killer suppression protein